MPLTATPRPSASGRGTDRPSFFLTTATTANQTLAAGEAGFLTTTGSLNSASNAIQLTGTGASLTNAGIVNATNLAVSIEPGLTGANVTNTGILASSAAGAVVASGLGATGIRVTNAGQILGGGTTTGGLSINGQLLLSISGLISAGGFAVTVSGTGTLASRIVNTGLIEALNGTAIQLNALGSDTVINTGTITGNILLGAGFDVYDGRGGTTDGIVSGGTGNDSYFVGDRAYGISELADASGGLDSVRSQSDYVLSNGIERLFLIGQAIAGTGSSDANTLTGNARDNLLDGASGNDTLFGLAGNDVLLGGFGNDSLEGGSLNDILDGREDDDTLDGAADSDLLQGNQGDDVLTGGSGFDTLTGGFGSDTFRFSSTVQAGIGVLEEVERITDFDLGDDIIDLSLIDANASLSGSQDFTFRGNTGIDGLGQVATTILSNGDVLITVNTSGDTTAEMMILLTNPIGTVTASDFIL